MTPRPGWGRWIEAQVPAGVAADDRPRVRVFLTTAWIGVALSGVSVVLAAGSSLRALAVLNLVVVVASLALLRRYARTADLAGTSRRFLALFTVTLSLGSLTTTPMELTTLCYLLLVPLVSAVMLSARETGAWFGLVAAVGSAALVAGQLGWVVPEVDPMPLLTRVMNFVATLGAALALLKALAEDRERSMERLREAERAKSAFFANVGHEIRTPMNGVLGMTDALLGSELGPREREMAETIRTSGGLLMALIDDLLDLSKLEARRLVLHPAPVPLRALLDELQGLWAPLAASRRLELTFALDPRAPAVVALDGLRLRQILGNLISNALKFTPAGRVAVSVRADDAWLRCSVEDTGIGISPQQEARLFERFVQADDARARRYQGTGLGLALSRELATQMGGTLGVTSTPGRGSCFTCALPLVLAESPAPSTPERRTLPPGLKVLVVDDNAVNRLVAQRLLERTGCQVTSATGASEALAAGPVDVVLMDVHMPELDGLEATRRLRARPGGEAPLIIGVSASAASEDIQSCLEAGMDDFLAKPVTQGRLLDTLLRHLDASVARGDKLVDGPRRAEVDRACSIPMQGEK